MYALLCTLSDSSALVPTLVNSLHSGRKGGPDWKLSSSSKRSLDGGLSNDRRQAQCLQRVWFETGERNGNPPQYSCLENPMDRGAWWAAVYRFTQSCTRLKRLSMHRKRKWQPTPVFLPREPQGQGSLVGCCLCGHTESDMTEVTQHQQQWRFEIRSQQL